MGSNAQLVDPNAGAQAAAQSAAPSTERIVTGEVLRVDGGLKN